MKRDNPISLGENIVLGLLSLSMILYSTFVYQTVWNWFIADLLFVIGYWQMFLGATVVRFIVHPNKKYSEIKANEEIEKRKSFGAKLEDRLFSVFLTTFGFGIFFIVNLIISYYS